MFFIFKKFLVTKGKRRDSVERGTIQQLNGEKFLGQHKQFSSKNQRNYTQQRQHIAKQNNYYMMGHPPRK